MTQPSPTGRPEDVDTGFWLWTVALVLMVAGFLLDVFSGTASGVQRSISVVFSVMFTIVLTSIVAAFLLLMRQGYRWARSLLTGGGLVAVLHSVGNLLTGDRQDAVAAGYAVTTIFGAVLIAGGLYVLHRKDADAFFGR